jgi:ketosteroid isomerase-like protein
MGAAEDVAVVRRGYQAFNTGDMGTLTELFEESASWHTPGRSSLAGDHEGRDATFAYFGQLGGQTGGTFRAELQHLAGDGDGCVITIHHNSGERDSKRLDVDCCIVFELRNGRVIDGREHFGDLYAWDEFWS